MKQIIGIFLFCFVASGSQFEPFEDMRREAGQIPTVGQSSDNRPVICYNPLWHNEEDVKKLANDACARTKRKAVFQENRYFACRLVNPSTAIYTCK